MAGNNMTIETIERWRAYLLNEATDKATDGGRLPHRTSGMSLANTRNGINDLCYLAIFAVRVKQSSGNEANAVAAEKLRAIADELSSAG
jgi:hypothetical protein